MTDTTTAAATDSEWLIRALTLALTAPTDEKAQLCAAMAEEIAARLTPQQVDLCQRAALAAYAEATT